MNKLVFAIAVILALIACVNISVTAEQESIAVNTKCQDKAWYLGTLNLTMGSCRIYNLSFLPGEKEITLHVKKNRTLAGIDA